MQDVIGMLSIQREPEDIPITIMLWFVYSYSTQCYISTRNNNNSSSLPLLTINKKKL